MFRIRHSADNEWPSDRAERRNGSMKTVLEEITSDAIDAEHVERRVDDWGKRLKGLYAAIGEWLGESARGRVEVQRRHRALCLT